MLRDRFGFRLLVASVLAVSGTAAPTFAHGIGVTVVAGSNQMVVEASYVGGPSLQNGTVSVLGADGVVLVNGTTGSDGRFTFAPDAIPAGATLIVTDPSGHRTEMRLTSELLLAAQGSADASLDSGPFGFPIKRALAGVGIISGLTALAAYALSRRAGRAGTPPS